MDYRKAIYVLVSSFIILNDLTVAMNCIPGYYCWLPPNETAPCPIYHTCNLTDPTKAKQNLADYLIPCKFGEGSCICKPGYNCTSGEINPLSCVSGSCANVHLDLVEKPENQTAYTTSSATFRCVAAGSPAPTLTWKRQDNRIIDFGGRATLLNESLTINDLVLEDEGTYVCVAENELRHTEASAYLKVIQSDVTSSDTFSTGSRKRVKRADCGVLAAPENGIVVYNPPGSTASGTQATFSCNTGYSLVGPMISDCQVDGVWSNAAPDCFPVDCGPLTPPINGNVNTDPGTTFGKAASYTCITGYDMRGTLLRFCQADGNWDGDTPICLPEGYPEISLDGLDKMIAVMGLDYTIPCQNTGDPTPTVSWTDINGPIVFNMGSGMELLGDGSLLIKNTMIAHSGTYTCTAANNIGSESRSFELAVFAIGSVMTDVDYQPYEAGTVDVGISCNPSCGICSPAQPSNITAVCTNCVMHMWTLRRCTGYNVGDCQHNTPLFAGNEQGFIFTPGDADFSIADWTYIGLFVRAYKSNGDFGMSYNIWKSVKQPICDIVPKSGKAMITRFNISCTVPNPPGWAEYTCALSYQFPVTGEAEIFMAPNTCNKIGLYLSPGVEDLFWRLDLEITHRCEDKSFSSVSHILQVQLPDNLTKAIDNAMEIIGNSSADDTENIYERIELIHSATGLLDLVSPETLKKDKTTAITDSSSAEFVKTTVKTEKTRLRGNLVEAISHIQTNTSMEIMKSAATALNKVVLKKEEVSSSTEDKALDIYSSYIGQFSTIEQGRPAGEVKDIAQTLLGGVATMIDIATDKPLNPTDASNSGSITPDESHVQVKNKTGKLLGKVLVVNDVILDRQTVDTGATAVETSIMNIQLEKVSKTSLRGKQFKSQVDQNDQVTSVFLPSNINLPPSSVIRVESMFMKKNIYTWGENSNIIKPPIMELNIKDDDMNALSFSSLSTPIKVILKFNQSDAPSSELPVYLSIQKDNGTLLNAPTKIRPGFASFETNVTVDEVVAFSLKLPSGITSCQLEIELDSEDMPSDAVGRGFRYPEDRCLIKKIYGKLLTELDEMKLNNKTEYCQTCSTFCCNATNSAQCTGVYEYCLYICNNVSQSNFTRNCSIADAAFMANPCQGDTSNHSDPLYIFPRKTMLSENGTTYKMYFRVSFDYEREEVIQLFSLIDEYCIGEPSVSSCHTYIDVKLTLFVTSLGCKFWDETNEIWSNNGLVLSDETSGDSITCLADHLTAFSTAVLVAPTHIDPFGDIYLFASFFDNPVVVTGVVTLWILYAFLMFWARRSDKADLEKVGVIYCADNLPSHSYCYLLCFVTALWKQSGTTANVFFYMKGTHQTSLKKRLTSSYRSCFKTGDEDWFLITTEDCLGDIESITIWHDNSGSSPHWYLDEVYVRDMQSNRSWSFINDDWLAVDRGQLLMTVTTLLPFSEVDFKHKQKYSILMKSTHDLRDQHLWISIFSKPPKSHFTRVQRLSCCLSLLLTTMLTNIMFYGIPTDDPRDQLKAGIFKFDVTQFVIGIESSLMMFPVEFLIVKLFMKLKPRPAEDDDILEMNIINDPSTMKNSSKIDETRYWQAASELHQELPPFPFSLMDGPDDQQMKFAADIASAPQDSRGRILPWWFLYIAWFVCISTCLVCSYLVMLYGLKFGYSKSVEWLVSFVTGFFTNVVIQQPVQVVVITMVLVMIFKKYSKMDKDVPDLERVLGEKEELFPSSTGSAPEYHSVVVKPLHRRQIASIRKRLRMEWLMGLKIQEAVLYMCYLTIVLIIVFGQGNVNIAYHNIAYVKKMFAGSTKSVPMAKVSTINDFYSFLEETVVPRMALLKNQTDETVCSDYYLIGTYRLRQLRVKRENCEGSFGMHLPCGDKQEYSWRAEDDKSYNNSWSEPSYGTGTQIGLWSYQSTADLKTIPYPGKHATYSGGGYVVEMVSALSNDLDIVTSLKLAEWIDDHTRAIFLEFTLYNPNIDLFTVAIYLFEFTNMGIVHPEEHLFTIKMHPFSQRYELFVLICELLFIGFNVMFIWVEIGKVRKLGRKKYFANSWTYVDIIHICLSISVVGLFLKKWAVVSSVKEEFRNSDGVTFINFYIAILWDLIFSSFTAALLFVVTLMSTKVLQLNYRLRLIVDALGHVRPMVLGYMLFFTLITLTFAHTANLVFGKEIEGFKSMGDSFIEIVCLILREYDFKPMQEKFPGVGIFYVVCTTLLYRVMLIAISITVYAVGFRQVKHKAAKKEKKLRLLQYLGNKIRLILNI